MDIKELLGSKYHEGMTAEEILAASVDGAGQGDLKEALDKVTKESAARKRQIGDQNKTIEDLTSQVAALTRESNITKHAARLMKQGFEEEDANAAAVAIADGDLDSFFSVQAKAMQAVENRVKNDLLAQTTAPARTQTEPDTGMTRERLRKMPLAEQQKFARDNPEAYSALYK